MANYFLNHERLAENVWELMSSNFLITLLDKRGLWSGHFPSSNWIILHSCYDCYALSVCVIAVESTASNSERLDDNCSALSISFFRPTHR